MGLIFLSGQNDVDFKLTKPCVMEWLEKPYGYSNSYAYGFSETYAYSTKASYDETIPDCVLVEYEPDDLPGDNLLRVNRYTASNDRAIAAPGKKFDSIQELFNYLTDNNMHITSEYIGCIY